MCNGLRGLKWAQACIAWDCEVWCVGLGLKLMKIETRIKSRQFMHKIPELWTFIWSFCTWQNVVTVQRRVWRYQRGNQNPYIEEEQKTQWPKRKRTKEGGVYFYLLKKSLEFNRKNIVTCNGKSILLFTHIYKQNIRNCQYFDCLFTPNGAFANLIWTFRGNIDRPFDSKSTLLFTIFSDQISLQSI
jgi:hypothetical protein